ncbi:MAG: ABC transporter ATP-binding protein [Peptococcaceae bacterium]|jgi:ABC-2 type transport system ATP-binding protein|nr:ABC transporter ATP-binding protein [Peptococcaceae bacterium]MDH7524270.1 ABC transporter ATP-binding protein [Peptococcaceae bacterium]
MLKIENISKHYGKFPALTNVSLEINAGMFGLLGPNGAGKTTLMRILTTLIKPTTGEISMGEINWRQPHLVRRMIGYLPQKFSLYKNIKVQEVLKHIAVLKGLYANREKKVYTVLEKVNLLEHRNRKIGELSGGMIRRVGIAQAILGDPQIIIVDEPTAGLDPEERIRFRRLLHYLSKESIVLISTHIVEDIEATCEQAAILHKGKIIAKGNLKSLSAIAGGKVWNISVSTDEYYKISNNLNIISSQRINDKYHLRIISDTPPNGALSTAPTLEDGYLYLMECVSK